MTRDLIRPFHAMEILARAKELEAEGRDICHLELGEPAGLPAQAVLDAVRGGLDRPMGYTSAKGELELRRRLARYYAERHGAEVDPESIIVTMGSSSGFILSFLVGFAPGARIAVTRPGYPAYFNILAALNMPITEIPVRADNGWKLTAEDVESAYAREPFDGLLLASPANPTGAALGREELAAIVAACDRLGVRFISDEIYHGLNYTGKDVSVLELTDRHIAINSFSKYYCMTGWRIGWLVMPGDLLRSAEVMAQNLFISASSVSQLAALAALDATAEYDARREDYAGNRTVMIEGLRALGFRLGAQPEGAFYLYADAMALTNDSTVLCRELLEKAGVAATPGTDFDRTEGHKYVRFSYAGSRETMTQALERMRVMLGR